jgi:hypothetical protein
MARPQVGLHVIAGEGAEGDGKTLQAETWAVGFSRARAV